MAITEAPYGILDTRNGAGFSVSYETQTEEFRSTGVDPSTGLDSFVFFTEIPAVIKKVTYNVLATESEWADIVAQVELQYSTLNGTLPEGNVIEGLSYSTEWVVGQNNVQYFGGSYTIAEYGIGRTTSLPDEYKIQTTRQEAAAVGGYFPDNGKIYFTKDVTGSVINRTSICKLDFANNYLLGNTVQGFPDYFIGSKSIANLRVIGSEKYIDLTLTLNAKNADLQVI